MSNTASPADLGRAQQPAALGGLPRPGPEASWEKVIAVPGDLPLAEAAVRTVSNPREYGDCDHVQMIPNRLSCRWRAEFLPMAA
jgi:hypothetical protein